MSTAVLDIQKTKIGNIQNQLIKIIEETQTTEIPYINTHHFAEGVYVRAFYGLKGSVVVSRVHLHENVTILCSGHCRVVSTMSDKEQIEVYKNFAIFMTPPLTKRALYFLEDTTILTVHSNPDNIRDVEELERRLAVNNFEDVK